MPVGSRRKGEAPGWVCVARVAGAHGVKGEVRLDVLTEAPATVQSFAELHRGPGGPKLQVAAMRPHKGGLIAQFAGVGDRNAAAAFAGTELFVPRAALPATAAGSFYHADLIGMTVVDEGGAVLGTVSGVANYGGGDVLELALPDGGTAMVPFTGEAVPAIDVDEGRISIDPTFVA